MIHYALINNITLIVALSILYNLIVHKWEHGSTMHRIVSGLLFGGVAVVGMMNPLVLSPGLIFDGRSISVSIAGFIGGWATALIAGLMAIAYRVDIGGPGTIMGVSVITASALVGVAYHHLRRRHENVTKPLHLLGFGIVVHLCMLILTMTLPSAMKFDVLATIAVPVMTIYPVGTLLVCLVLLEQESRILAEKAVHTNEKKYRELVEGANSIILRMDREGCITFLNDFGERFFGFRKQDILGRSAVDTIVPGEGTSDHDLMAMMRDIAGNPEPYAGRETENVRSSGERVWIAWSNRPVFDDNGGLKEILCIGNDITDRKRAERALRESEAKQRSIVDNIGMGVCLISPAMEVLEFNSRMREWFPAVGADQHAACYRVLHNPPRESMCDYCPARKTFEDGLVHEVTAHRRYGDATRSYRLISSPVFDVSGEVIAVIEMADDITERLSLESQLQQAVKLESIGRLAGGVAHDFNNMLGVIIGHTELVLNDLDPRHRLCDNLEEIRKAADHSADLTQQLLAFARKQTIAPKVVDLNETLENILRMVGRLIGEDIGLAWIPAVGLWSVKMDPSQVDQILTNLCVNARDAIGGGGKITVETGMVTLDAAYCDDHPEAIRGDFVTLAVSDNGCGMDRETMGKIFEPFFTTKEVGRGTGLGLATVYGIVKQNRGFINVYSEPGRGTTFRIYLPRYEAETERERNDAAAPEAARGSETVLLVEDEAPILNLAKVMLESFGYRVLAAPTPGEAIRLAGEYGEDIHLLIADVVMPEMNGRELERKIASLYPGIRCLFMSGYTANAIAHHGVLDEGVHFLQKPFSMQGLAVKVRSVLNGA